MRISLYSLLSHIQSVILVLCLFLSVECSPTNVCEVVCLCVLVFGSLLISCLVVDLMGGTLPLPLGHLILECFGGCMDVTQPML